MSIIKTRKLIVKRTYLLVEKEEIEFACSQSEKEIKEYMLKYFEDEYEEMNKKKEEEILQKQSSCTEDKNKDQPESVIEEENVKEEEQKETEKQKIKDRKDPEIKKLYRLIAQKTHPDKAVSEEEATFFNVAATCYRTGDIGGLLFIAEKLGIEIPPLSNKIIKIVENKVNQLEREINSNKETIGWLWYSCETDEDKTELLKKMLLNEGYTI